jgi:hypothetical protein
MESKQPKDFATPLLQRRQRILGAIVSIAIVGIWTLFAVDRLVGTNVLRGEPGPPEPSLPLGLPLAVTIGTLVIGGLWYWRDTNVIRRGVRVTAEVVRIHGIIAIAFQEITLRYTINDRVYEPTLSATFDLVEKLQVGSTLEVMVDAKRPKRCMLISDVS